MSILEVATDQQNKLTPRRAEVGHRQRRIDTDRAAGHHRYQLIQHRRVPIRLDPPRRSHTSRYVSRLHDRPAWICSRSLASGGRAGHREAQPLRDLGRPHAERTQRIRLQLRLDALHRLTGAQTGIAVEPEQIPAALVDLDLGSLS